MVNTFFLNIEKSVSWEINLRREFFFDLWNYREKNLKRIMVGVSIPRRPLFLRGLIRSRLLQGGSAPRLRIFWNSYLKTWWFSWYWLMLFLNRWPNIQNYHSSMANLVVFYYFGQSLNKKRHFFPFSFFSSSWNTY